LFIKNIVFEWSKEKIAKETAVLENKKIMQPCLKNTGNFLFA
jgi:hypothetical protein